MNEIFVKSLVDGRYAVRIVDVFRRFVAAKEKFCIKIEVITDLQDYCYPMEEFTIVLDLIDDFKSIKWFFYHCPPMLNKEQIFSTPTKKSAAYDQVRGLKVFKGQYNFYDINEYCYTQQLMSDDEKIKPF